MIAYIQGKLTRKEPAYCLLDIQGVGYELRISLQTFGLLPGLQEICRLHTHLNIREDAHVLYGFMESDEKLLFLDLIGVTGIGPNTALVMLSSLSSSEIRQAIVNEDIRTVQSIKGIGAKTAQRVFLELKDKLRKEMLTTSTLSPTLLPASQVRSEALAALITLGIAKPVAEKSVDLILRKEGNDISVEQLIKLALR